MTDHYIAPRRPEPLYAPEPQQHAAEDTAANKDMQQGAADFSGTQEQVLPSPEDFTISVEQVREHFRAKGLTKSKDTVQRWCRTGDLACQKRGVLGRYFTTEASLLELERKLLPDMIAENAGAFSALENPVQVHAVANTADRNSVQPHAVEDEAARSDVQVDVPVHAAESSSEQITEPTADVARLSAEVDGLRAQLENRDKQIDFLQEEIRSGREQRGAVVQISNRMLETLETMAIGGRLERPNRQGAAPEQSPETVHVHPDQNANDRV